MRFRNFDKLRTFCVVAKYSSITSAADALNLTKGAVSHQIDQLESELGFNVFIRSRQGIELSAKGHDLFTLSEQAFLAMEREISHLRRRNKTRLTIGMATYFASRWLSPRLMRFITQHEDIGICIQPLLGKPDLQEDDLDMAIRWGKGEWQENGETIELLFTCPAVLTSSAETGHRIETEGIESVIGELDLLHDSEDSDAWADWFQAAGLSMHNAKMDLVIPDPNVRLQAVTDGQGVGLYDRLAHDGVNRGKLYQYMPVQLDTYGFYLVYPESMKVGSHICIFRDWIVQEAQDG